MKNFYLKLSKVMDKIKHFLKNNFVLTMTSTHVILFKFIKIKILRHRRAAFYGYLFISLWLIGFIIFSLYPLVYSLFLSFTRSTFNIQTGMNSQMIGFNNYVRIISDVETIMPMYVDYMSRIIIAVPLVIVFSIIIAVLINQVKRGKGIWRTIFFLPVVISSGPVLNELINQGMTSLPSLEENAGLQFIMNNLGPFIANPIEALMNSLLYVLWYAGIPILIMIAGLNKIDPDLYEASSIDGASPWDNFWSITLPSLKPLILVNIIYVLVSMSLFVEQGGILELARAHMDNTISEMWFGYGYAAAMMWVYFIIMVVIMGLFIGLLSIHKKVKRS
jgi:ABC-type sugar transport system permease subunit